MLKFLRGSDCMTNIVACSLVQVGLWSGERQYVTEHLLFRKFWRRHSWRSADRQNWVIIFKNSEVQGRPPFGVRSSQTITICSRWTRFRRQRLRSFVQQSDNERTFRLALLEVLQKRFCWTFSVHFWQISWSVMGTKQFQYDCSSQCLGSELLRKRRPTRRSHYRRSDCENVKMADLFLHQPWCLLLETTNNRTASFK